MKRYTIRDSGTTGCNSGRPQYSVVCNECNLTIHKGSTGPYWWLLAHEEVAHRSDLLPNSPLHRGSTPSQGVK